METLSDFEIVDVPKYTEAQLAAKIAAKDQDIDALKRRHEAECIEIELAKLSEENEEIAALKEAQEAVVDKHKEIHALKMAQKNTEIAALKQQYNDERAEADALIAEKDEEITEKDREMAALEQQYDDEIRERLNGVIADKDNKLIKKNQEIAAKNDEIAKKDEQIATQKQQKEAACAKYMKIYTDALAQKNQEIARMRKEHQAGIAKCIEDAAAKRAEELERFQHNAQESLDQHQKESEESQKLIHSIINAQLAESKGKLIKERSDAADLRRELEEERSTSTKLRNELETQRSESSAAANALEKKRKEYAESLKFDIQKPELARSNYYSYDDDDEDMSFGLFD
ncbi:hypothetical protein K4K50_011825 [Colletotrichum sp. SAR 10_71]|nr:hypothetical protein K4K50_011825 [Colletotrichum sp. SAR 10_71]